MSSIDKNILKSLAVLEGNLKDINSAKEQVNNVVKSSSNLASVIESYKVSFESLSINVEAVLEDSRKFNNDSIKKLSEQTTYLSKEIAKLTEFDVSKTLESIESETIKQFQQNLSKPLSDLDNKALVLQSKIDEFKAQISRVEKVDLESHLNNLQTVLTNQSDKQNIALSKKYDEVISKSDNIIIRLGKQEKETKTLKTLLLVAIGIIVVGIVTTLVMK